MAKNKESHEPATLDSKTLRVLPTPQLKLATIDDCRREMARVYRDARLGDTDTAEASRLVYMLSTLAKLIETSQLEERIAALEKPQPTKLPTKLPSDPVEASKAYQKIMTDK